MASKIAFIQEWNDIVDYKISENDLSHPTVEIFYKALESLLRKLNVNVDYMKQNLPDGDPDRMFYIRFCKHVNRLYKLSDSSFNFYFLDLFQPTPKKTAHLLKTLLNYLKFYEMSKKEVINKSNAHLSKYNDALREKNELETKIEKNKRRAQNIQRDLADYETKMTKMREIIDTLTIRATEIDDNCAKMANELKTTEQLLQNLDAQESELDARMVNENEYEHCLRDIQNAEKEVTNLKHVVEFTKSSNMDTCRAIDEMALTLIEINALIDGTNIAKLEETNRVEEKWAKLRAEIAAKEDQIKDSNENEVLVTAECQTMLKQLKQRENDIKHIDETEKAQCADLAKRIKNVQDQLKNLHINRANGEENLHEEEETHEYLIKSFDRILNQIAATFDAN